MEQICFELKNIEVSFLDKEILSIDHLAVYQFDRIGIVGKNGAGKSTLLKLLAGEVIPAKGRASRFVEFGYFQQREMSMDAEADAKLLGTLAVPKDSEELSGGEQTRLKLAQLFSNYYEALLLDEPTTHLDKKGITFLIEELRYYYGALLLISHDRNLLDELVTTIWEIEDGKVNVYAGNYTDYAEQKRLELEMQREAYTKYVKEKSRLEKAAEEKMKKAEKIAKAAKANPKSKDKPNRMFETKSKATSEKAIHRAAKAIEGRLQKLERPDEIKEERPISFPIAKALELHNKFPIMADQLILKVGDRVLLDKASFQFPLGKKTVITGPNGCGKSTLLKAIAEREEGLIISPKAKIGVFHQMSYQFETDENVLTYINNRSEYDEGFLRSMLHLMQFEGNDLLKKVKDLSGGEAIRLQLCQLFLGKYNILLLDEPTNFLDVQTIEALEKFVHGYEGTIVFVSHDERFVRNVSNIQYTIKNKKLVML